MLIINTESPTLVKSKMVYLFINGKHIDTLKTQQVKQYKLDPGVYQVAMRLNFYRTDLVEVEIKEGTTRAFELILKNNWKFYFAVLMAVIVGATIDMFVRAQFGNLISNIFIVLFFVTIYAIKIKVSKNGYLLLEEINKE